MRTNFAIRGLPATLALLLLAIGVGPARARQQDADLQRHLRALEKAGDYASSGRIADSIAALGDRAVPGLETLLQLLDHKQGAVRSGAMTALEKLGPLAAPLVPTLMEGLAASDGSTRLRSVTLLLVIAPDESRSAVQALALHDPSPVVRGRALPAVTSPTVLADIVREDSATSVRKAALRTLEDQQALGELASAGLEPELADAVFRKLDDRDVLMGLVDRGPSEVRFEALAKLPSFVVADIVRTHPDPAVRLDAVWVATDVEVLRTASRDDVDEAVREAAGISVLGKPNDVRVTGLDCKPQARVRNAYDCDVRIVNNGTVAYTALRYVLGGTFGAGLNATDLPRRLDLTLQPGETRDLRLPMSTTGFEGSVQFRVVGMRKTAPGETRDPGQPPATTSKSSS